MTGGSARPTAGPIAGLHLRLLLLALIPLALAACGGDEEPEPTFEDRLAELEGRELTPVELARRAEIGETLCQLDDQVLDEIWQRLDDDQLDFHDIVIAFLCPDRAILYAGHTGRRVTEEAVRSGVRTSTTRPTSTTTTGPTTSRAAAGPSPTSASTSPGDTTAPSGSPTSSTTARAATSSTATGAPTSAGTTSIVTTTTSS